MLGAGIFPAKDGKDRWVLRENSHRERAAVGLLGFCLKFILLGKEMDHWAQARKKRDVLQEGSRGILCGCALWDCVRITSLPGAPSPICGVCRRGSFSQRRDRKSSCATQYHVILCRWRSLALDDVPSAGTLVATVHSRENPRIPHDERLVPIFLWRRGFEWFMGAQKAPWARHTGHRAAAQHSC